MEWLQKLFKRLELRVTKPPSHQTSEGLAALPPEMILLIASLLPDENAACLALCNRLFSQILGPSYWGCLRNDKTKMDNFLRALEKDLPQSWTCLHCQQLHPLDRVFWPQARDKMGNECISKSRGLQYCTSSFHHMQLTHIQLAMKRHNYGFPHGFPLDSFNVTEVLESTTNSPYSVPYYASAHPVPPTNSGSPVTTRLSDSALPVIYLFSVDAQIISREFLTRSQLWVLVPQSKRQDLVTKGLVHHLCRHVWFVDPPHQPNNISDMISTSLEELATTGSCSLQIRKCPECHMDFTLEAIDFGNRGVAVVLTRWHNFGSGLNEADVKWNSHIEAPELNSGYVHESHVLGSIQQAFEKDALVSEEQFTAWNILKLFFERTEDATIPEWDGYRWKRGTYDSEETEWHLISYASPSPRR